MPADPPPKRPRRRWLRLALITAALAGVAVIAAGLLAVSHLDWIARFAIHRMFPGVTARMGALHAISLTRLEVSKLTLQSSKTRETLLSLEGGVIVFSFADVWRARLREVRLTSPDLVVSPELGVALGVQPTRAQTARPSGADPSLKWAIGRLVVSEGRMRITSFGEKSPSVDLRFAADFTNFGVGGEAARVEHAIHFSEISARDANNHPFLAIGAVDLKFTTEELFGGQRLREARIAEGWLTVGPGLIEFFQPNARPATEDGGPGGAPGGWTLGALDLAGLDVQIPDAPGLIGRATFHVVAELRNLGSVGTPEAAAGQRVTVSKVDVSTDAEPSVSLLTADAAEVRFTVAGLTRRQLEDVRLENPSFDASPAALLPPTAKTTRPGSAAPSPAAAAPPPWLIRHVSCNFGTLRLRGLKGGSVNLTTHFAFEATDLGTTPETANRPQELTVWDAQAVVGNSAPFLTLDVARIGFTPGGLSAGQRIESVQIDGGRLTVGDALQKLLAGDPAPPAGKPAAAASNAPSPGWTIGTLAIAGVRTRIEDRRPGLTDLRFTLNTTLHNVQASGATTALLEEVQTVEFANIDLRSPLNRAAKILSLRSVFVRFTLRDLARRHLREIVILQPSIFLSQDLFVYMERATAGPVIASSSPSPAAALPAVSTTPNWSVDHLEVKFGRLVIGSGGSKDVGLPLEFETTADNLALDNLASLQLQAVLRVPKQSYDFPAYQLEVNDVVGDLRFSYPPEKGEKNLVQKLDIAAVRWRQYRAKKTWVAATFDARGINGLFGGAAYGGYVNGGFSFFFQDDSPWIGWVAGTGVDTQSLTDVISPQNFSLTGPIDFEMQLDAFRKNIERVRGVFHLTEPGRLKIGKLDALLADMPPQWSAFKRSSTRIALETLRDFDYTTATGDFWFVQSQGILNLDLLGPQGSRKFEVALHDGQETPNQWQQGKLGKK